MTGAEELVTSPLSDLLILRTTRISGSSSDSDETIPFASFQLLFSFVDSVPPLAPASPPDDASFARTGSAVELDEGGCGGMERIE